MTVKISDVPVRRSVVVHAPVDDASAVFTEEVDSSARLSKYRSGVACDRCYDVGVFLRRARLVRDSGYRLSHLRKASIPASDKALLFDDRWNARA